MDPSQIPNTPENRHVKSVAEYVDKVNRAMRVALQPGVTNADILAALPELPEELAARLKAEEAAAKTATA